jgi:hypothetical protein
MRWKDDKLFAYRKNNKQKNIDFYKVKMNKG